MSGRDDGQDRYPVDDSGWPRSGGTDPLNPPMEATALVEGPVDLAAVQADDALLNMLGSGTDDPVPGGADAELARVLVAWRREVNAEPFGDLVDPDTATTVITAARRPEAAPRHPFLGPFAAAAAVLVIVFSGLGLVAKSAQPGDQLWSLTKVLYTDYAHSVEAAQRVRADLAEADTALKEGNTSQAKESLERVQEQLSDVNKEQNRDGLVKQYEWLEVMLAQKGVSDDRGAVAASEPPIVTSSPVPVVPPPTPSSVSPSATPSSEVPPTESTDPSVPSEPPTVSSVPEEPGPRSSEPTPGALPGEGDGTATSQPGDTSQPPGNTSQPQASGT